MPTVHAPAVTIATPAVTSLPTVLALFADDTSAPGQARAELGDWQRRWETCTQLLAQLRTAGDRARHELAAAKRNAPSRLAGALATGKVAPELIGTDLPALRAALDAAEDRYGIARQALAQCERELTQLVYLRNADELLPWVAAQRCSLPWWQDCPAHVLAAWAGIARCWQVTLPYEACQLFTEAGPRQLDNRLPLVLNRSQVPRSHPVDRHYWAWQCIAAGAYAVSPATRHPRCTLRITGDWEHREPLPPAPAPTSRTGLRRLLPAI